MISVSLMLNFKYKAATFTSEGCLHNTYHVTIKWNKYYEYE